MKRICAVILSVLLLLTGCAGSDVYTVVLPKSADGVAEGGLKTYSGYSLQDIVPAGLRIYSIAGFDNTGRAICRFVKPDGMEGLFSVDGKKNTGAQLCIFESAVTDIVLADSQTTVVYAEQEDTTWRIHSVTAAGAEETTLFETFGRTALLDSCIGSGEGKVCLVTENNGELSLFMIDVHTAEYTKYDMGKSLKLNIGNYYSQNLKLEDIATDGSSAQVLLLAENKYYIWAAEFSNSDEPQSVKITECEVKGTLCGDGYMYFLDGRRSLIKKSVRSEREYVVEQQADDFAVSADGEVIMFSQNSGTATKVFAMRQGSEGRVLVDIRQNIEGFVISGNGEWIAVKYMTVGKKSRIASNHGFSVTELSLFGE